jgi:hypothetical protein
VISPISMRLRPLIAPPIALSLLPILTGCHLSRVPSPALSMAAVALSAGGTSWGSSAHSIGRREIRKIYRYPQDQNLKEEASINPQAPPFASTFHHDHSK